MISSEVINAMIDLIDENIRLIEEIRSQGFESFSKSFRDIQAAKHSLQEAIEACLDIGSHIIAERGFRRAEDYKDIYNVLEEEAIIDPVLSSKLQEMAKFRNLLVHRYGKIDTRRLFIIMSENTKDIQDFVKRILKYIPHESFKA
ncbi:MAG: DUF86 domain-containing protein [Candidatus Methanoperedens sp.]|nr:DUF86 domain-containing protein [Candidatus Methanoperedens sp.]MCZ7360629.1 DUF86 domain-containing protein [Candidatus Methanoperedens sp.]HLB71466.1 DUF86 domain-containing protein [Candidatus Methanoperedens sp.]